MEEWIFFTWIWDVVNSCKAVLTDWLEAAADNNESSPPTGASPVLSTASWNNKIYANLHSKWKKFISYS